MIRNLHSTVTIDSVLANSKTQNAFLFTVNAIFRHDYPLAVEPASTPRPVVKKKKKFGEILCLLICSFLPCLSWLLRSRVRKSQRDLWITLYIYVVAVLSSYTQLLWRCRTWYVGLGDEHSVKKSLKWVVGPVEQRLYLIFCHCCHHYESVCGLGPGTCSFITRGFLGFSIFV